MHTKARKGYTGYRQPSDKGPKGLSTLAEIAKRFEAMKTAPKEAPPQAVAVVESIGGIPVAVGVKYVDVVSAYPHELQRERPSALTREEKRDRARTIVDETGVSFDRAMQVVEAGCAEKCMAAFVKAHDETIAKARTEGMKAFTAMYNGHVHKPRK